MREITKNIILSYMNVRQQHAQASNAVKHNIESAVAHHKMKSSKKLPKIHVEKAARIAAKHTKGAAHNALVRAIHHNDKKMVHEHFKQAKADVFGSMERHSKAGKPVKTKARPPVIVRKVAPKAAEEKTPKNAGFMRVIKDMPAYHHALKTKRPGAANPHPVGSMNHRAHTIGLSHRTDR